MTTDEITLIENYLNEKGYTWTIGRFENLGEPGWWWICNGVHGACPTLIEVMETLYDLF